MEPQSLIFDLDGTLWDPAAAIAAAWNRVIAQTQIPFRHISTPDIRRIAGLPHDECIRVVFEGLSQSELQTLNLETQREDQNVFSELPLPLFDGVTIGIERLSKLYSLFIVSNCQKGYIENFLKASRLEPYFTDWECWGNTERPKGENVRSLIRRNSLIASVFIGDTPGDETAAHQSTIPYYHVAFGYGVAQRPVRTFADFYELTTYFLKAKSKVIDPA